MSSSHCAHAVTGFVVLYSWRLHPLQEEKFQEAWEQLAEMLYVQSGALGSRLHRADNGTWVAYNQWPDKDTWERARTSPPRAQEVFARLREAIAMEFPPVLMESVTERPLGGTQTRCARCAALLD